MPRQKKGIFTTLDDRHKFVFGVGSRMAQLGGELFGTYRDDADGIATRKAFEKAKTEKLYARVELTEADFCQFEEGFKSFQRLRIAMQLEKARVQLQMDDVLRRTDLLGITITTAQDESRLVGGK